MFIKGKYRFKCFAEKNSRSDAFEGGNVRLVDCGTVGRSLIAIKRRKAVSDGGDLILESSDLSRFATFAFIFFYFYVMLH